MHPIQPELKQRWNELCIVRTLAVYLLYRSFSGTEKLLHLSLRELLLVVLEYEGMGEGRQHRLLSQPNAKLSL